MSKKIAILGSTGSIGTNSLRVIEALGPKFEIVALTAHSNTEMLAGQVRQFKPKYVGLTNPQKADDLRDRLGDYDGEILVGPASLVEIAGLDETDTVITAVVGAAGLGAVLEAAKKGKTLAIANKEPLVIAGQLLTATAKANGAIILPIDSEHSAVFQALQAGRTDEVSKIILTASGGPFRNATAGQMENATVEEALAHPTWEMGRKVTVDSATMMNKALEVIEARWLFDVSTDKIDVLVHPESIVHSMVEFVDGSVVAMLGQPDMCVPIQYALTYPRRVKGIGERLKLGRLGKLTFEKPNRSIFRALDLGFAVAAKGNSAPVVFNAANEVAVQEFLAGRIRFGMIVRAIEHCVNKHEVRSSVSLEELLAVDTWARGEARRYLKREVEQIVR
ncbi:MAG: 1-deoxy-D-xylulose-5-phosphate reductoisomerase [Planctomycetota bacterium]|mgnify:CR=1 FL=1|nr:MAG: 1-deoxy-D-xylulose-5-phosphate reductoisomerase [Planctomycetota bacterium]